MAPRAPRAPPAPAEAEFVPTFSRLTATEDALARAQAAVLGDLLPFTPSDSTGSTPATPAARADAWAAGFAMEVAPGVELHYWTNVALASMLCARAAAVDPPALLPPDEAVAMARPPALENVAQWWHAATPGRRREIFSFVVARTAGMTAPAARAGAPAARAHVYAGCVDTVRLCRAGEAQEVEAYKRARAAALRACAACGTRSADLLRCAACGDVAFCDRKCQAAAWAAGHKKACKKASRTTKASAETGDAEKAAVTPTR